MVSKLQRDHYVGNLLDEMAELKRRLTALEHTELSGVAGPVGPTGPTGPQGPEGDPGVPSPGSDQTITGLFTYDRDPATPFAVTASSAKVDNLDADKLDGYEASAFPRKAEAAVVDGAWQFTGAKIIGDGATDLGSTTAAEKLGHIYQAESKDLYPASDKRGLFVRVVDRTGLGGYTDHFRSGSIPTGYAWQGAPFTGTPPAGYVYYSINNDYMWLAGSGGAKSFLSKAITNAAASWQNKSITARVRTGYGTEIGVRVDDGSDDNYAELYVSGALVDGTQRLDFRHREGGGAVSTTNTGVIIPCDNLMVILLLCSWSDPNYRFIGYTLAEDGGQTNIAGVDTGVVTWCPAAGRVGLLGNVNDGNYGSMDFFYNTFT
jgi:hypothetical protein